MVIWRDLRFGTKLALMGTISVLLTTVALVIVAVWQSGLFTTLALGAVNKAVDDDLTHLTGSIYDMIQEQDAAAQQRVNSDLNVARYVLNTAGQVSFSQETLEWNVTNQADQQSTQVQLPKLLVGGEWLGQNDDPASVTPIVDNVKDMVGTTATIFQRMNEQGDMLRVATNVMTAGNRRAIGTFIPAVMPDGAPDPVLSAVLKGEIYHGQAFVVNAWYLTAYEPIRDANNAIVGMLYVGVKRDDVAAPVRQTILKIKVGQTGYVYVLGSQGDELGRYIISQNGERDGENIWTTQDSTGNYVIQSIVNKALALKPGEFATERYLWQNPGDPAPRWKVARIAYYGPWHWVIGVSTYEDELQSYQTALRQEQIRLLGTSGAIGLGVALLIGLVSLMIARSMTRPLQDLTDAAARIAGGELAAVPRVEQKDEIGHLAQAFKSMTTQLREVIGGLEQRVAERTADLERRSEYLTAQAEIARIASAILDADQLMQQVVELIRGQFDLYYVGLFTVDETGEWVVLRAGTGEAGQQLLARGYRRQVGEGVIGWTIANKQARFAEEVAQDAVRMPLPELPETRSEATLPLRSGERVWGALDLQSRRSGRFDKDMIPVLQTMADQLATAMENARLFAESQAALQATRRAYGEVSREAWTQMVSAQTVLGYRSNPQGVAPSVGAWRPEMAQAVKEQQLIRTNGENAPAVAVPIQIRDHVVGALNFRKGDASDVWTEEEIALLKTLAEQLGVALEGARLYQDTQRRAAREKLIGEVTSHMRESLDMEAVLKAATDELYTALELEEITVRLISDR